MRNTLHLQGKWMFKIFVINPGSTSTKVAYFENVTEKYAETLHHSVDDLTRFPTVLSQLDFRLQAIQTISDNNGFSLPEMDVFVGRGGLLKPIPGGTYLVDENMVQDLTIGVQGEHASNLGGLLANDLAKNITSLLLLLIRSLLMNLMILPVIPAILFYRVKVFSTH